MKMRRIVALLTVCMVVAGSLTITAQAENLYSESIVQMEDMCCEIIDALQRVIFFSRSGG